MALTAINFHQKLLSLRILLLLLTLEINTHPHLQSSDSVYSCHQVSLFQINNISSIKLVLKERNMPDLDLTEQNDVLVGRRVVSNDGGHYATVLFHGKVGDTKGEWLGVEWDDSTRGKHAGTHEGVQYFMPKNSSPTSSSFIRLNKVCFVWMNYIDASWN